MNCELCGLKPAKNDVDIEGTMMKTCVDCSKFGEVKNKKKIDVVVRQRRPEMREPEYIFIKGYGMRVKSAREKLGLKQEEMAKRLNERESLLHQIESEHLQPNISLARKLERELHIKIFEEIKNDTTESSTTTSPNKKSRDSAFTFGDMMKR
jgi:putative transcription factor